MAVGGYTWWSGEGIGLALFVWVAAFIVMATTVHFLYRAISGGIERRVRAARKRIARFVASHPGWAVRVYRTPSGLRAMATHQRFAPNDPAVTAFFDAVGADPVYVRMCINQQCFRARLTPKPWRIGISAHMKPRPGVWPARAGAPPGSRSAGSRATRRRRAATPPAASSRPSAPARSTSTSRRCVACTTTPASALQDLPIA